MSVYVLAGLNGGRGRGDSHQLCGAEVPSPSMAGPQLQRQREHHVVLLLARWLTRLPGHSLQVHTQALGQLGRGGQRGLVKAGKCCGPTHSNLLVEVR